MLFCFKYLKKLMKLGDTKNAHICNAKAFSKNVGFFVNYFITHFCYYLAF